MSTIFLSPQATKEPIEWSFWDSIYMGERILEITSVVLYQISDFGKFIQSNPSPTHRYIDDLIDRVDNLTGCLYCMDFIGSLHLMAQGKFIDKHRILQTASRISSFVSELLTPIYWLHEKEVLFLGKCADLIGKSVSLFEGLSYTLWAIEDVKILIQTKNNEEWWHSMINLMWYILWLIGKALEYLVTPTHLNQAFISIVAFTRLSLSICEAC